MNDLSNIKKEILNSIGRDIDESLMGNVRKELEHLESTEGTNGESNLKTFYNIWEKNKNKVGKKNAINSWTAYALGMTTKKPSGDFLPYRRTYARAGFPDIDVDFDDERRGEVYEYLIDKYGRENVGNIGTYISQKMKAAVRNVCKAVDAAYSFHKGDKEYITANHLLANEITQTLNVSAAGFIKIRDEDGNDLIIKKAKQAYRYILDFREYMDKYPDILAHVGDIEGLSAIFGSHAAGVVISNVPLRSIAPLRQGKRGLATQFSMEDLESVGLIKFDILAIAALTTIRDTLKLIEENYAINIDIENLPLDDKKTLKLYRSGKLNGVFQCENSGMQDTMKQIGVDRFSDIIAAVALYRPGPIDSIPEYVARKKGHTKVNYFHESIEPFVKEYLEDTYGVLCYQESVMQIMESLAGFSKNDAYVMIKAIGKKKAYLMDKYKNQFIDGCGKNKVPKDVAEQYWKRFITPFASYGFNKSHATCYGFLSYQTAYLKANYPDEFSCAFLNTFTRRAMFKSANDWDNVAMMAIDAQRTSDIKILPKNINDCDIEWKIVKKKDKSSNVIQTEIRPPVACKGMGYEASKNIAANRPYGSLNELAKKTNFKTVGADTIGALAEAGFFKGKKGVKSKDKIVEKFIAIRKDLKALHNKGLTDIDIFAS